MVVEHHQDLSIAREQMLQHILQIEDLAALKERKRIAREIHDSLGNALTTLNIQLQTAHKLWDIDHTLAEKFLSEAQRLGAIAIQEVRKSVSNMREIVPVEQSITDLIDSLVQNFYQVTGILPAAQIDLPASLSPNIIKNLYRIIQEALTNICKYAKATKVDIILSHTDDKLSVIIQDNGKGFKLSQNRSGYGIQGMQERVSALKGSFDIDAEPGYGCRIIIHLPWEEYKGEIQPCSATEFRGEVAEPSAIEDTYPRDLIVDIVDPTPNVDDLPTEVSLQIPKPIPIEELTALEFNLKSLDTTLLQHPAKANFNLELLETIPIAENDSESCEEKAEIIVLAQETNITTANSLDNLDCDDDFINKILVSLSELIGPVAACLVKRTLRAEPHVSQSELIEILARKISDANQAMPAFNYQAIIDRLSVYLAERDEFLMREQASNLVSSSANSLELQLKSEDMIINCPDKDYQPISESLINQCEQNLAEFIGPMASFVVKKAIKSSAIASQAELITMLAAAIPDAKKAAQFQQRLMSR